MPSFWLRLVLLFVFSLMPGWLPVTGRGAAWAGGLRANHSHALRDDQVIFGNFPGLHHQVHFVGLLH